MCIICEIRKRGEQIHEEMEAALNQEATEQRLADAQYNIDMATAVGRLTKAAQELAEAGRFDLADRAYLALDLLLPKREERRTGETAQATDAGESPTVDTSNAEVQADMANQSANKPLHDDMLEELPTSLRALITALGGADGSVKVFRFPKL